MLTYGIFARFKDLKIRSVLEGKKTSITWVHKYIKRVAPSLEPDGARTPGLLIG